jgi:ABC-type spermidine/putrescine transport system permease subunit II
MSKIITRANALRASLVSGLALAAGSVHAALPAAIATELDSVKADGLALADLVWPVVISLFGALVLFKLFKRFGSKI